MASGARFPGLLDTAYLTGYTGLRPKRHGGGSDLDSFDVIYDYIQRKGRFVALSNDVGFLSLLRTTLEEVFAVGPQSVPTPGDPARLLETVAGLAADTPRIMVFVDRHIKGRESTWVFRELRRTYPDIKLILVSEEVEKRRLILYHEMGANNFLMTPSSEQVLMRKMALTIRPPGSLPDLETAAYSHLRRREFTQAIRVAWKILAKQPRNATAHLIIGDAHMGMCRHGHAVEAYRLACRHLQIHLEPLQRIAAVCASRGDQTGRLKCLQKMDHICPVNPDRKLDMGSIHYGFGNRDNARDLFKDSQNLCAMELGEYLSDILVGIGNVYAAGEPGEAEKYYRRAIEVRQSRLTRADIAILNRLGLAMRRTGKWRSAVSVYKQALEIDDADENLFYNIAMAYAEGKEFRRSSSYVMAALRGNPHSFWDNALACYNLAMIFHRSSRPDLARRYAARCLECEPDMERARKLLAKLDPG